MTKHLRFLTRLSASVLLSLLCATAFATTKTFDEAADTTLETADSLWAADSTGIETNGTGAARVVSAGTPQRARYENSQGDTQYSQVTFQFDSSNGYVWIIVQNHATQAGYEARLSGTNSVELRKNGGAEDSGTFTGEDWSASATYTCGVDYVVGTGVVRVFCAAGAVTDARTSGTEIVNFTDGSPLTSGYPGFEIRALFDQNSTLVLGWTDAPSAGSSGLLRRRRGN